MTRLGMALVGASVLVAAGCGQEFVDEKVGVADTSARTQALSGDDAADPEPGQEVHEIIEHTAGLACIECHYTPPPPRPPQPPPGPPLDDPNHWPCTMCHSVQSLHLEYPHSDGISCEKCHGAPNGAWWF